MYCLLKIWGEEQGAAGAEAEYVEQEEGWYRLLELKDAIDPGDLDTRLGAPLRIFLAA